MKSHAALNRVYRLVWSQINQCWVAVAETAKGQGKKAVRRKVDDGSPVNYEHSWTHSLALTLLLALTPTIAHAGLEGGAIVGGQGAIVNPNLVIQNSSRLAIDAKGFNVGAGEIFNLQQQSVSDMALIRVLGQSPSDVFGTINAKGQLLISNPNGILFGRDSQVNVGGLIATTLNIDAADFMFSNYNFYKNKRKLGSVVNEGTLTATDGGYIALLAPEARNEGVINARLGTAAIIAGNKVTLNLNEGAMVGYAIDEGAINALVENKHLIQADGGQVFMGAKAANSLTTAVINNTGIIRARTVQNQNGKIMLMGDMQAGTVNVGGTLDASAPAELNPKGGNGGFIETSAAHVKVADSAKVTTLAANGKNGTWLIDPVDFTIAASGGDMSGAAVTAALAGGNFTIQSTTGSSGINGDINVNDTVSWSANELTLDAQRNININANLNGSGTASLFLKYGQASAMGGVNDNYFIDTNNSVKVNLPAGDNFRTQAGNAGPVIDYTVITDLGAEGSLTGTDLQGMSGDLTKNYVLGADIDATVTSSWNSGFGWAPVGDQIFNPFTTKFDGLGHAISNLTAVNRLPDPSYADIFSYYHGVGLFGYLEGSASVQNLHITNANVRAETDFTALGAAISGAGILAGLSNNATIFNVYTSGTVTVLASAGINWHVGGLTGAGGASVIGSSSSAKVTNLSTSVGSAGGLMGSVGGTEATSLIEDSFATGEVIGGDNVGGLVGKLDSGEIIHSWATGQVTGHDNVGGLVGNTTSGTIRESYAQNALVTGNERVGGLVGVMDATSNIVDSYANSPVTGVNKVGGLLGANNDLFGFFDPSLVLRSYAGGSVNGATNVGGLVGYDTLPDNVTDSYWNTETTGQATSVGGLGAVGKTTAEMQTLSTFTDAGWDIDNAGSTGKVWRIYEGQTAPLLRYFLMPLTITANDAGQTYSGLAYSGGNGVSYSQISLTDTLNGSSTYTGMAQGAINAGSFTLSVAASDYNSPQNSGFNRLNQNYDISYADGALTINPAPLLITANGASKSYNGQAYAGGNGVVYNGFVNGETGAVLAGALTYGGNSQGAVNAGSYAITANGLTSSNYAISYADGALTIDPKDVTVTANSASTTYNGLAQSVSGYTANGLIGTDMLAGLSASGATQTNVGTYTNIMNGSNTNGNYTVTSMTNGSLLINPAPLLITASDASKTYDGQAYVGGNGVVYNGFVNGETGAVLAGALTYGGNSQGAVNAGSYAITANGLTSSNYAISYADGALTIIPAAFVSIPPVLSATYLGAKEVSTVICTGQSLSGAEAFVEIINGKFALTEVASFELDANEVVTDTSQLELSSNCLCDDTNRSFKNVDVTVLNGGVRMPRNRLSSYQSQENIELIKTPRVIRSRSTL